MQLDPAERDPVEAADWLELETLYSGEDSLSFEALCARITMQGTLKKESEADSESNGEERERDYEADKGDLLIGDTIAEIDRRFSILGDAYPFQRKGRVLALKKGSENCVPYLFCLLVADREYYSPSDPVSARLFEHLVTQALAAYMGGKAIRFGSPRDTMPSGVNDAINELSRLIGDERIGEYPVNATDKDLGLDVVGWHDFPDKRKSKLEVFMQCATGDDWEGKRCQCDLSEWQGILFCTNDRLRGLAIPYVVADEREWKRAIYGLLFMDRVRISSAINAGDLPERTWADWCKARIKEVGGYAS